jgi:hypothetical protein
LLDNVAQVIADRLDAIERFEMLTQRGAGWPEYAALRHGVTPAVPFETGTQCSLGQFL